MAPLLLLLLLAPPAHADPGDYRGLVDELHSVHPDAARHLSAGLDAWVNDPDRAEGLLSEAIDKAPGFAPIAQVGCELALERGARSRAIHWCRQANTTGESPETMRTLALALATPVDGMEPTPDELREAATLAVKASLLAPDDAVAAQSLCEVALYADDGPRLQTCVTQLQHLDPDGLATAYFTAHYDAARGRFWAAKAGLDRAKEAGLAPALYDDARRTFARRWSLGLNTAVALLFFGLGWQILSALLLAGTMLTVKPALAAVSAGASSDNPAIRRNRAAARLLSVVAACSVLVALGLVVGIGLAVIRQLVNQPLPEWGIACAVAAGVVALYGLFLHLALPQSRPMAVDVSFPIDLGSYPALKSLIARARDAAGAGPLDRVLLVPDASLSLRADAGSIEQLIGHPERHLWLGVAQLGALRTRELEALVARELARDHKEDDLLRLRRLLPAAIEAREGLATARSWNPWWRALVWWVGALETITDPWARVIDRSLDRVAEPGALRRGLQQQLRAEQAWERRLAAGREDLLDPQGGVRNLYARPAPKAPPASPDHLLQLRLDALPQNDDAGRTDKGGPAWSLFGGRDGVEQEMTRLLRRLLTGQIRTGPIPSTPSGPASKPARP